MMNGAGVPGKRGFNLNVWCRASPGQFHTLQSVELTRIPTPAPNGGRNVSFSFELESWDLCRVCPLEFEFLIFVPHNGRVFKLAGIIFCAALLLAGDAAAAALYPSGKPLPPNWPPTETAFKPLPPLVQTNFQPIVVSNVVSVIAAIPPATLVTNPPPVIAPKPALMVAPVIPPPAPAPVIAWTPLSRWAAEHNVGVPRRISDSPVTTYAVGSTNGVMVVGLGTLGATWNGVEIMLGFEPQMIDGEIYLHGLDLQKNLEPLLCGTPPVFSTNRVIVIDPGHGGANLGAKSVLTNRYEKEFTLDVARRLKPLLESNGWKVFLTRTSDVYVTNFSRVVFAGEHHADLFVSLHFNSAAPDTKQNGIETYCLTPTGMPSTLTRGYADMWSENLPNNAFDAQNFQIAVRLHNSLLRATGMEDRGVRRARFMDVLRGQPQPAILIEGGYLSNPHEAKRIQDPEFRQKLAEAIANALK
jgi:N-acetylmuramoyl-L-alanine amidase